jgi:hypothetical protein
MNTMFTIVELVAKPSTSKYQKRLFLDGRSKFMIARPSFAQQGVAHEPAQAG